MLGSTLSIVSATADFSARPECTGFSFFRFAFDQFQRLSLLLAFRFNLDKITVVIEWRE